MSSEEDFLQEVAKEMHGENTQWMTRLARRYNLLYNDIPHVPILVEDIPKYIALIDYEENCIKKIQTIGKLVRKSGRSGVVVTISPNQNAKFGIELSFAKDEYYRRGKKYSDTSIWEESNVFKVFGNLVHINGTITLAVSRLVVVDDVIGSWSLTYNLSKLARREYRQYYRTPELDEITERAWEKMRAEGKRRVPE